MKNYVKLSCDPLFATHLRIETMYHLGGRAYIDSDTRQAINEWADEMWRC